MMIVRLHIKLVYSTYFLFDKGVVLVLHFRCGLCSDFVN